MEYAKHGDFFDALITHRVPFNETLIRTYFHQLIDAMDALHSKGAAHLDIKLENLLIGDDYTLKTRQILMPVICLKMVRSYIKRN